MAAKKKSNTSKENDKPTRKPRAKKASPKPKKEQPPKEPEVSDEDFGLDDIELEPVSDSSEEGKTPTPIPDPVENIETDGKKEVKKEIEKKVEKEETKPFAFNTGDKKVKPVKENQSSSTNSKKKEEEKKDNSIMILVIVLVFVVIAALLYFFVFKKDKPEPEPVKIEQPRTQPQPEPQPEPEPEPEPEPIAELFTISAPEGRFYVVVGSFYDGDLAEDKAKAIVASGTSAYVLKPQGGIQFHRVGIVPSESSASAEELRSGLLETYGENIWVLKY